MIRKKKNNIFLLNQTWLDCLQEIWEDCCLVARSYLTLPPHELQHTRPPCSLLSPRVCSSSCGLSWWRHQAISSSAVLFSSWPQSSWASGSFSVSQLFISGGQSIGAWASASVLPMNIQGWFPLGLTDLISLLSKECSKDFSSITIWKHQFFGYEFKFSLCSIKEVKIGSTYMGFYILHQTF